MIHLHDETTNQTFFVNITLLGKNSCRDEGEEGAWLKGGGCVDCVSLETPPVMVDIFPSSPQGIDETPARPCR